MLDHDIPLSTANKAIASAFDPARLVEIVTLAPAARARDERRNPTYGTGMEVRQDA